MTVGGHLFARSPWNTSHCARGCGSTLTVWGGMGPSVGPDPWGPCPLAPDPTYVRPREERDAEMAKMRKLPRPTHCGYCGNEWMSCPSFMHRGRCPEPTSALEAP